MNFQQEITLAMRHKVAVQERRTKSNCPYLRVLVTGARVDFVTAIGGKSFHVHVTKWAGTPEYAANKRVPGDYLGMCGRDSVQNFIRVYGSARPRDLDKALDKTLR